MQADIGPVGEEGAETFDFTVCTPSGLADRLENDERPFWGRGLLIVRRFDWDQVEAALNQYVRSLSGEEWHNVATKLNRVMCWEFEDYQDFERR
jgi:Immunity protein 8